LVENLKINVENIKEFKFLCLYMFEIGAEVDLMTELIKHFNVTVMKNYRL
jgi:hypothetical protein